uniref:non-specific serine/threonine protein kinase n=1 Tax=Quercus lobata TaxID=97700 RepID=A0A7N2KW67_QUELO
MNSGFLFRYPPLVIFFITILVFVQIPVFLCYDLYASCNNKYHCGDIANVDYPFWGAGRVRGCGKPDLFLNCTRNITLIEMRNVTYRVLSVNMTTRSLKIAREDYYSGGICSPKFVNTTLDSNFFVYSSGYANIMLVYGCLPSTTPKLFSCQGIGSVYIAAEVNDPGICKGPTVFVPVPGTPTMIGDIWNVSKMEEVLREGFEVNWEEDKSCSDCIQSNGVCGNDDTNQTTCFSAPPTEAPQKPQGFFCGQRLRPVDRVVLSSFRTRTSFPSLFLKEGSFGTDRRRKRQTQKNTDKTQEKKIINDRCSIGFDGGVLRKIAIDADLTKRRSRSRLHANRNLAKRRSTLPEIAIGTKARSRSVRDVILWCV